METAAKSTQTTSRATPAATPTSPAPAGAPASAPAAASYATGRAATQPAGAGTTAAPASAAETDIVTTAIAGGQRNVNLLTDKLFYSRHPTLQGQRVVAGSTLASEWTQIRDTLIKPQLQAAASAPAAGSAGDDSGASASTAASPAKADPAPAAAPATAPTAEAAPITPAAAAPAATAAAEAAPAATAAAEAAPAATAAATEPSMLDRAKSAAGAGIDAAVDGAKSAATSAWSWLTGPAGASDAGGVGGPAPSGEAGAAGGPTAQASGESGAVVAGPAAAAEAPLAANPAADELKTLMANERLDPDQIKRARELIGELPTDQQAGAFEALQTKNAYHSQRDNASTADDATQDNMCNLTSLAMCLEYQGIKNPKVLDGKVYEQFEDYLEAMRIKDKLGPRTESGTLQKVAAKFGVTGWTPLWSGAGKTTSRDDWTGWNAAHLATGKSIIMSIKGHIVRVQGVSEGGLVVDDPYGVVKLQKASAADYYYKDDNGDTKAKGGRVASSYSASKGAQTNEKGMADNKGEDNVWPWADVEAHAMWWAVAIG